MRKVSAGARRHQVRKAMQGQNRWTTPRALRADAAHARKRNQVFNPPRPSKLLAEAEKMRVCRWIGHAWRDVKLLTASPANTMCLERCRRCGAEREFDQQDYH